MTTMVELDYAPVHLLDKFLEREIDSILKKISSSSQIIYVGYDPVKETSI